MKKYILPFLIVVIPLLRPYSISGINLDILALLVVCFLFVIINRRFPVKNFILKPYAIFTVYSMLIPPLAAVYLMGGGFSVVFLPLVVYIFISMVAEKSDFQQSFRIYKWIVIACCVFFFIQEIVYHTTSLRISGLLPFLDNAYTKSLDMSTEDLIERQGSISRSSSIFLEPAHFVQYIAPCLCIMLLKKECSSILGILIVTLAMLLSRSGNGMVLLAISYTCYLFSGKVKLGWKLLFIFVVTGGLLFFSTTQNGEEMLERTSELSTTNMERHSGFVRVYRGYILWNELSDPLKVLGVGKDTGPVFENSSFKWMFFSENDRFLNGIQSVLICNGIIGLIIILVFFYRIYKFSAIDIYRRALLYSFLILMFMESIFNSSYMVFYLSLILCDYRKYISSKTQIRRV